MEVKKEYTDFEIIKQAQIVLTMMLGMITTDIALKAFLYNLALLNSMAHKSQTILKSFRLSLVLSRKSLKKLAIYGQNILMVLKQTKKKIVV